jgi:hypothetical protein
MLAALLMLFVLALADEPSPKPALVVVVGAPGSDDFGKQFHEWADRWQGVAEKASAQFERIGTSESAEGTDRERLKAALTKHSAESIAPLWIVFIGHGTFDGQAAKFNLRGPDLTASELAEWVAPVRRPLAIINCASASGPFLNKLAGKDRVIIAATRSGSEQNFARYGDYIATAMNDLAADLDKDGQVSLLEAHLTACRRVAEFYQQEARLATEHALVDDNGDGLGTPSDWFRGIRATKRAKDGATLDGTRAHQLHLVSSDRELRIPAEVRRRRDELELKVAALQADKEKLGEDEFYTRLEPLMVELARIYGASE